MWVTESEFLEHSACARWLAREPPPPLPIPRAPAANELPARDSGDPKGPQPAVPGQHSQLSWEEHAWYLRSRAPEQAERLSQADTARLQRLHALVVAEQAAFREQRAAATDVAVLRTYHPHVAGQVRQRHGPCVCLRCGDWTLSLPFHPQVETALNARRQRDAGFACDCEAVSVMELHRPAVAPPLQHLKLLASTGDLLPLQAMPPGTTIPLDVLSRAPEAGGGGMASHAAPVDEDPTCERMASAEHAAVVLGSGAFECLASLTHSWEVPVHVRAAHTPGGPGKPIVFVGKPFLPDSMTLRAKNEVYYKVRTGSVP